MLCLLVQVAAFALCWCVVTVVVGLLNSVGESAYLWVTWLVWV